VMLEMPSPEQASQFTLDLLKQGVIIRPLASFGLPRCVRISTGSDEDHRRCLEAVEKVTLAIKT
jgi:histidinol-phosphate aminotransferase